MNDDLQSELTTIKDLSKIYFDVHMMKSSPKSYSASLSVM